MPEAAPTSEASSSPSLTPDLVLSLAPDSGSAANARKLATPGKWPSLHASTEALWGECQGSGSQPYLVGVDLRTPELATKCSCPSRKFPCKHGLALMLLYVNGQGQWGSAPSPEPIQKWLDGRQARSEAAASPAAPKAAPDPAAQAKREAARHSKITRGLADVHLWLRDLVREGLPAVRALPYRTWDAQAARLVDAQVPGAARLVRQISDHLHAGEGEALLAHLGKVALLCEGWTRRDTLSEPEQLQLMTALGQPLDTALLLTGEGQPEAWSVLGNLQDTEGHLEVRRTWLRRVRDGQVTALFDFAPGGRGFSPALPSPVTATLDVRLVPTLYPQRALLAGSPEGLSGESSVPELPDASVADLYRIYAEALARNPWLERVGTSVGPVRVLPDPLQVQDASGHALPLGRVDPYDLLAQERSRPMHLFGEWDGREFVPIFWQVQDEVRWPEAPPSEVSA